MQYSPRFVEAIVAEIEPMLTSAPRKSESVFLLLDHPVRGGLHEEVRPFEVDPHHPIVALLGGFEQVVPLARPDARVVDEHVEPPEVLADGRDERLAVAAFGDIGRDVQHVRAEGPERVERLAHLRFVAPTADGEVEALARERLRRCRSRCRWPRR